jgi:hypothetical protein
MDSNNGWSKWVKISRGGSVYAKYKSRIVVIVPDEKNRDHVVLTAACFEALGKPKKIDVLLRGTNVAFVSSDNGYAVTSIREQANPNQHYVSLGRWRKEGNIKSGVYEAHIENGMIVFDTAQTPAKI